MTTTDSEDGSPTAEATAENDDDEDTDDSEPTPDDDDEDDDDPFAELEEITDEYEQVDGSVTYTVTTDGEESTWTVYTEGDNSRIDFGDEEGAFVSITTPEASYTCWRAPGGYVFRGRRRRQRQSVRRPVHLVRKRGSD